MHKQEEQSVLTPIYSKQANKALNKMQPARARSIIAAINAYAAHPKSAQHDVRKLQGRAGYRLRIGDWRVIFDQDGTIMDIVTVHPRGGIY